MNKLPGDSDIEILKKYRTGRSIDQKDKKEIDKLATIGLIKCGVSLNSMTVTATTSDLGKILIEKEE